ncbi:unnamed protein product [Protopolystoma xenopodis]|uniref:Uncharacterized protein n=1 Tax=Protopolystoma xenopodis TaxID=117903 RepID=A0A3S5BA75_9PLAT|nr:unnamed protein product [Protopolystoma xenopodis]
MHTRSDNWDPSIEIAKDPIFVTAAIIAGRQLPLLGIMLYESFYSSYIFDLCTQYHSAERNSRRRLETTGQFKASLEQYDAIFEQLLYKKDAMKSINSMKIINLFEGSRTSKPRRFSLSQNLGSSVNFGIPGQKAE